jgi:hypothetical protein
VLLQPLQKLLLQADVEREALLQHTAEASYIGHLILLTVTTRAQLAPAGPKLQRGWHIRSGSHRLSDLPLWELQSGNRLATHQLIKYCSRRVRSPPFLARLYTVSCLSDAAWRPAVQRHSHDAWIFCQWESVQQTKIELNSGSCYSSCFACDGDAAQSRLVQRVLSLKQPFYSSLQNLGRAEGLSVEADIYFSGLRHCRLHPFIKWQTSKGQQTVSA